MQSSNLVRDLDRVSLQFASILYRERNYVQREGVSAGGREGERERWREGERNRWREGGRDGGIDGGREGGREG